MWLLLALNCHKKSGESTAFCNFPLFFFTQVLFVDFTAVKNVCTLTRYHYHVFWTTRQKLVRLWIENSREHCRCCSDLVGHMACTNLNVEPFHANTDDRSRHRQERQSKELKHPISILKVLLFLRGGEHTQRLPQCHELVEMMVAEIQ